MARYDLRKLRTDYKITQKELADKLKVTQGFLSSVEKWRNPFPDERIDDLQNAFPDVDLSAYEVPEEEVPKMMVGSNNNSSQFDINDPALVKQAITLASSANITLEKAREEAVREAKYWRDRYDALEEETKKLRTENTDLREEVWRLKELLLENGISYKKKDDNQ